MPIPALARAAENEIEKLSKREREVLDHLAEGISYKEIADVLSLSIDTVRGEAVAEISAEVDRIPRTAVPLLRPADKCR